MTMMDLNSCNIALIQKYDEDMEFFVAARDTLEEAGAKVHYYGFTKEDINEEIADLAYFYDYVVPSLQYCNSVPQEQRLEFLYVSQ